jgi:predicted  nucleic acid-binding Zn-ribbon protein
MSTFQAAFETEIKILKNKLKDYEQKVQRLQDENRKIEEQNQLRMKEIEQWKA